MKRFFVLFCAVAMLFCMACSTQDETSSVLDSSALNSESVIVNIASEAEEAAPSPAQIFSVNPVSAFYSQYRKETENARNAYRDSLVAQKSIEGIERLMDFEDHLEYVMRPNSCIGRLSSSGEFSYADTLYGAAMGSGSMTLIQADIPDQYRFVFTYDNGDYLRGSFQKDELCYTLHSAQTIESITTDTDEETGGIADLITSETIISDARCICFVRRLGEAQYCSIYADELRAELMQINDGFVQYRLREHAPNLVFSFAQADFSTLEQYVLTGVVTSDGLLMCSSSKNVSKRSPKRLAPWST